MISYEAVSHHIFSLGPKERCVNCGKTTFTATFSYDKNSGALKKTPIYGDFCSMGCSMEALHKL